MKLRKSFFFLLFSFIKVINAYSFQNIQVEQTDSSVKIHKQTSDTLIKFFTDTNLTGFQFSRPGYGSFFYKQTLGNLGSAFRSTSFSDDENDFFNLGINQFRIYEVTENTNIDIPKTKIFSELQYFNGSKREQNFAIRFFQQLTKQISYGLGFGLAPSDGYYTRQNANQRNFNIYFKVHSKKEKYHLLLKYLSNKIISQENGGLTNDSTFEGTDAFNSKVVDVNFNDVKNQHKSRIYYLQHQYNFFKKENSDSTIFSKNKIYVKHIFKYNTKSVLFTADQFYDSFFEHAYYDTTGTYDSLFVNNFYNQLSFNGENFSVLKGKAAFYLAADHQYFNFIQEETLSRLALIDTVMQNISLKPGGNIQWNNGLGIDCYFLKNFNDLSYGNHPERMNFYEVFASAQFNQLKKNRSVKLSFEHQKRNPDFIYNYYNSNHFIWNNQFNPIDFSKAELSGEIKFSNQSLKVATDYFSVKNLTYFNDKALPQQFSGKINVLNLDLLHSIRMGKFNLINNFKYQHPDDKEIVRLPDFTSYTSFFYENKFFKRALYGQFGIDVRYCTLYLADAYMPATGQFYLQNEKKIGNYAYLDLFANFRIKTFRFFLKYEHLNAGFSERGYYTVPHYPMAGGTFKWGIRWQFFD
jgi:hypothetical protein